uniref:Uncharacterized protein n=1 Tax=Glossina palpalis gambiensis TaxID=67801 RepID=A0A1B0AU89_9MUSC
MADIVNEKVRDSLNNNGESASSMDPIDVEKVIDDAAANVANATNANELKKSPEPSVSCEELDELSSLEREIAKMHHAEEFEVVPCLSTTKKESKDEIKEEASNGDNVVSQERQIETAKDDTKTVESLKKPKSEHLENSINVLTSNVTTLEHDDLIAVLKGLDSTADGPDSKLVDNIKTEQTDAEGDAMGGVTIEGEGEYQIIEVIDEDSNAVEEDVGIVGQPETSPAPRPPNITKKLPQTAVLTSETERALALEQIALLKADRSRRRKQDIKPIQQQPEINVDLVSALGAEWSDEDLNDSHAVTSGTNQMKIMEEKKSMPQITSVVVISPPIQTNALPTSTTVPNTSNSLDSEVKTSTEEAAKGEKATEQGVTSGTAQTGFRRTRIIKRKIIWDPDAPETTFSYAKLVKSNPTKSKVEPNTKNSTIMTKGSTTITAIKKEPTTARKIRPATPKDKKVAAEQSQEKKSATATTRTSSKTVTENSTASAAKTSKTTDNPNAVKSPTITAIKRRSQTPIANGSSGAPIRKKKVTEIDRLMGDEGAVNMLNSLETAMGNTEEKSTRPVMRSRATMINEKSPRVFKTNDNTTTAVSPSTSAANSSQITVKTRRTPRPRASATWDYVYQKQKVMDDSMIIRRRSNSSYSSNTSIHRLSIDGPQSGTQTSSSLTNITAISSKAKANVTTNTTKKLTTKPTLAGETSGDSSMNKSGVSSKSSVSTISGKTFEFAKPENKVQSKIGRRIKSPGTTLTNDLKKTTIVPSKRNVRSPATTTDDKDKSTKSNLMSGNKDGKDNTLSASVATSGSTSDVVVKKAAKVAQIIFNTSKAKLKYTFTAQMMNKLVDILDKLRSDTECHAVVMSTTSPHFCQGIDITDLTVGSVEKRKSAAFFMAAAVKNYLKALATYPKPLIAAVNGNNINLGVMQLALFDIVVAGEKCTFETPYVKIGQVPEGYCIWNNITKIRGSCKTKLFWLGEKLQTADAALSGLLNKLTAPTKVNEEAVNTARKIASMSAQTYRVMKKTIVHSHLDTIATALDDEFETIISQWISNSYMEHMRKYLETGEF